MSSGCSYDCLSTQGLLYTKTLCAIAVQVQCGDQLVERVIEEKIDQFYGWVEKHPGRRGQVRAVFHDLVVASLHLSPAGFLVVMIEVP